MTEMSPAKTVAPTTPRARPTSERSAAKTVRIACDNVAERLRLQKRNMFEQIVNLQRP